MHLHKITEIPSSTLSALHTARLRTVSNVLSLPPDTLLQLTSLSPSSIQTLLSTLYSATAARAIPLSSLLPLPSPLRTGSSAFDDVLDGGLRPRAITQLAGQPATGKTHSALAIAAHALRGGAVVWLDSSSTHAIFSRISTILAALTVDPIERDLLLSRLIVLPASTVSTALACLRALRKDLVTQHSVLGERSLSQDGPQKHLATVLARLKLVVFDSVANVLAPVLGLRDGPWSGHVALNQCATELRWISSRTDAAVLVTNRVVRDRERLKPALGNTWTALVDVSIRLEVLSTRDAQASLSGDAQMKTFCRATVSSKKALPGQCQFQLCEDGIKDV